MPSVIDSITSFISSIVNAVFSVFTGFLGLIQNFLNTVLSVFGVFFSAIGQSVKELASTFEGLTKFLLSESRSSSCCFFTRIRVRLQSSMKMSRAWGGKERQMGRNVFGRLCWFVILGNIVVIGALAVLFVGYTTYQSRQGRPVTVGNKKVN